MYEEYLAMTANNLHDHLTHKLKLHPEVIKQIKDEVAARKEAQRKERITRTARRLAWQDLLQPLRRELNNARVGLRYEGEEPTPERVEAFTAYIKVLEKLLAMLELPSTVLDNTPAQLAKERNASGKGSPIPHNGLHWTDWVPTHIKQAVAEAFDGLPHKHKAKRKVPFKRTVPREQHMRSLMRLMTRTKNELANAERKLQITYDKKYADEVEQIRKAMDIINRFDKDEVVPPTWHGVLKNGSL